ncbi:acetyltransferase [Campylobacter upsaliensis]|nr:acetyltransferase [Campylobacter upsaliensis]
MPGVRLRRGCIIGAGAVLTKDTDEFGVYAGIPAIKIRQLEGFK